MSATKMAQIAKNWNGVAGSEAIIEHARTLFVTAIAKLYAAHCARQAAAVERVSSSGARCNRLIELIVTLLPWGRFRS